MLSVKIQYRPEELREIEGSLKDLTLQVIAILKRYREEGLIDENEFRKHVELKENFLLYLERR